MFGISKSVGNIGKRVKMSINRELNEKLIRALACLSRLDSYAGTRLQADLKETLFFIAAKNGNVDGMAVLLSHGVGVNIQNEEGWTALKVAAAYGRMQMVLFLMANGADLDIQDQKGWTPLMSAVNEGNFNCAQFLIDHGADVLKKDKEGKDAYSIAMQKGYGYLGDLIKSAVRKQMKEGKIASRSSLVSKNKTGGYARD